MISQSRLALYARYRYAYVIADHNTHYLQVTILSLVAVVPSAGAHIDNVVVMDIVARPGQVRRN